MPKKPIHYLQSNSSEILILIEINTSLRIIYFKMKKIGDTISNL